MIMLRVSATEFQEDMTLWMDRSEATGEPLVIARDGRQPMVMVPLSDCDQLDATDYLRASPENERVLNESIARANVGEFVDQALVGSIFKQ